MRLQVNFVCFYIFIFRPFIHFYLNIECSLYVSYSIYIDKLYTIMMPHKIHVSEQKFYVNIMRAFALNLNSMRKIYHFEFRPILVFFLSIELTLFESIDSIKANFPSNIAKFKSTSVNELN